jgi:hypothetical protein
MVLKCGHPTYNGAADEEGSTPFQSLLGVGTSRVNELAKVQQHRLRKIGRFGDVGIDSGVSFTHSVSRLVRGARDRRGGSGGSRGRARLGVKKVLADVGKPVLKSGKADGGDDRQVEHQTQ